MRHLRLRSRWKIPLFFGGLLIIQIPGALFGAESAGTPVDPSGGLPPGQAGFAPAGSEPATVSASPAYYFSTLAGFDRSDDTDGVGPEATFFAPARIAADRQGNFYIADRLSFTIRRLSASGVVTTIAGKSGLRGFRDGAGSMARFYAPEAIAVDAEGEVFVSDWYAVRQLSSEGTNWVVTTVAGQVSTSGYRDGAGLGARFGGPAGLAAGPDGAIYVADGAVRKLERVDGTWVVSTVANAQGYTLIRNFTGPDFTNRVGVYPGSAGAIGVRDDGALFVTDPHYHNISMLTLPAGTTNWVSVPIAGQSGASGWVDGIGNDARFWQPDAIALDRLGNLYVGDGLGSPFDDDGGRMIRVLSRPGPGDTNWRVSTLAGRRGTWANVDGIGTNASFTSLAGLAADPWNNLAVVDGRTVRKVTASGVVQGVAGSDSTATGGSADGVGNRARFNFPGDVAVDREGNVYVADSGNSVIRVVTSAGLVTTLAGSPSQGGHADGVGGAARFGRPEGIAVDAARNVFVADGDTVRMITPAAVVSTIGGSPGAPGYRDGPGSEARFSGAYDVAVDREGNVLVSDAGNSAVRKLARVGTNWHASTIAPVPAAPQGLAVGPDGRIFVMSDNQIQELRADGPTWVIRAIASAPPYQIAVDGLGRLVVTTAGGRQVVQYTEVGTNWVRSPIGGGTDFLSEGGNVDGAGLEARFKVPFGIAVDGAGNLYISDVVNNNIRLGTYQQIAARNVVPLAPLERSGQITVMLQPSEAGGQWRFPTEPGWRNSGDSATNLVQGNYVVEFRTQPGWLPLPSGAVLAVTNGATLALTNDCFPTLAAVEPGRVGSLTVQIGPSPPPGAGWRFVGENAPYYPPGQAVTRSPGAYAVEFAPVTGRARPATRWVHLDAGTSHVLSVNYLLVAAPPSGALLPTPVPAQQIDDSANYPYAMNGQLQSEFGYGSGVAVQTNVVLTAAHLVFNDHTLSYVREVYWHSRKGAGDSEPLPMTARGWYVLAGYAAQRTNDLLIYPPDSSTPQSRSLDVAALYFLSPVASGGYSGFLPSDAVPNVWLTGNSPKTLVGYPVDGSTFGNASIVPGRMYQTEPLAEPLVPASDQVANQQIYVAPWLLAYPGNSGGPIYVEFNGTYYPAGIYLGTLYNGTQPFASAIRGIDSQVERLIALAARQGDSGTNNTGGGVTMITPSALISANNPGYLQVRLEPLAAVQAGAAWKLTHDNTFSSSPAYTRAILSTNPFSVEFRAVPGWQLPAQQQITVLPNPSTPTIITGAYSVVPPRLLPEGSGSSHRINMIGTTGTVYRLETTTEFSQPWRAVSTNVMRSPALNPILTNPAPAFYRLQWLP